MTGIVVREMTFDVDVGWVDAQHDMQHFRTTEDGVLDLFGVEPGLDVQ